MYKVIHKFYDLKDNNHEYKIGNTFPRKGVEVGADRIEELESDKNRLGVPLIEEIAEKPKRTRKKKDEE